MPLNSGGLNTTSEPGGGGEHFSGKWSDITGKPNAFEPTKHGDSKHSVNYAEASQLFSGNYSDLSNKPNLFSGNYNDLSNVPNTFEPKKHGDSKHTKNYATVGQTFSGNYNDLTNVPNTFQPANHDNSAHSKNFATQSDLHSKYTNSEARNAVSGSNMTFGTVTINNILNLSPQSSAPGSPAKGDTYLDDGTNTSDSNPGLRYYDGTAWVLL